MAQFLVWRGTRSSSEVIRSRGGGNNRPMDMTVTKSAPLKDAACLNGQIAISAVEDAKTSTTLRNGRNEPDKRQNRAGISNSQSIVYSPSHSGMGGEETTHFSEFLLELLNSARGGVCEK